MDNQSTVKRFGQVQIGVDLIGDIDVLVVHTICNAVISVPFDPCKVWPQLQDKPLADCYPRDEVMVDMLVGLDYLGEIVGDCVRLGEKGPFAMETVFGWVLYGDLNVTKQDASNDVCAFISGVRCELSRFLQKFWDLESIGVLPEGEAEVLSVEDQHAVNVFLERCVFKDGRYEAPLIFKPDAPILMNNYAMAYKRLQALECRLRADPALAVKYCQAIETYMSRGDSELVPAGEPTGKVFYLPHHPVVREDKESHQVRVVMDASAQGPNRVSLNDCLVKGPNRQPKNVKVLLRHRERLIAVQGDISKMFLQIKVPEEDRNMLRWLWRDLNSRHPPREYRMTVTTFGVRDSPFKAAECVQLHARKYASTHMEAVKALEQDLYVDDLLSGADTEEEALKLVQQVIDIMDQGGFQFQKWATNSSKVLAGIPEDRRSETASLIGSDSAEPSHKALGLLWEPKEDQLLFRAGEWAMRSPPHTKTAVMSCIARLYDPLGLISPVVIQAKIMMQECWKDDIKWTDEISPTLAKKFQAWLDSLKFLEELRIPRCVKRGGFISMELHAFGDASKVAYGAAIYLVLRFKDGSAISHLVLSKTRVAPLHESRVPRLELLAALLVKRLVETYKEATGFDKAVHYWTDSLCVWHWLQKKEGKLLPFVANRVQEILKASKKEDWRHVAGTKNPADMCSRGLNAKELLEAHEWFHGPAFILLPEEEWPTREVSDPMPEEGKEELRRDITTCLLTTKEEGAFSRMKEQISDGRRMLRATARMLRLSKPKAQRPDSGRITPEEMACATQKWITHLQEWQFPEEFTACQLGKEVAKDSKLVKLSPKWDVELSCMRVGGRLQFADLPEEARHPIILPGYNEIANYLILQVHYRGTHSGSDWTLYHLRFHYWLVGGKRACAHALKTCRACKKASAKAAQQKMGQLPAERVTPSRPFSNIGLDFMGPLHVHNGAVQVKRWVLLFTCMVTRAVHLELVSDMTTETFFLAFRRMVARVGMPANIWSDNAKQLKKAALEIRGLHRLLKTCKAPGDLATCNWHFIPEKAPHWGGFYERLNASVKRQLIRTLQRGNHSEDTVRTVLCEVEASINSRPLATVSESPNEMLPVSPSQLLLGYSLKTLPQPGQRDTTSIAQRWKHRQHLMKTFWAGWQKDYLHSLTLYKKWHKTHPNLKIGDTVLVSDDKKKRLMWPMGLVEAVDFGRDGRVRSVHVRTLQGTLRRAIHQLHPLEFADETTRRTESSQSAAADPTPC